MIEQRQNKIPQRLKELRMSKGWSKTDVANKLEKTLSTYANWEYGSREPDAETIIKLSELYNVSIDYILGVTDYPYKPKFANEVEDFLKNSNNLELRKFIIEIQSSTPEDLQKLYTLWRIIKGNHPSEVNQSSENQNN